MPDVNVTYADMQNAATRMTSTYEEMTSQLGSLRTMVDDLVENGFKTDVASGSFHEAYTEFNQGVLQTLEGLQHMSTYLVKTAQQFEEVDRSMTIRVENS
jgi:WXG100 family type VII secretion target